MKYNILHIAYPFAPVSSNTAGGAEQILYLIDKALTGKGHNSCMLAGSGSSPKGKLIEFEMPEGPFDDPKTAEVHANIRELIYGILKGGNFDIIHMHGIDFDSYLPETDLPVLVTLHLPVEWYNQKVISSSITNVFYNCVSRTQQNTAGNVINLIPFIENGIDIETYKPQHRKGNYVLSLGRICWEKGYNLSIMASRMAGVNLVLAGKVFPYYHHQKYFEESVLPFINGRDISFIDSPDLTAKKRMLSEARCVLIPSLVPETSSLVAMEALASGTPVIGFPSGALSEIIEHGKTGFIVNNTEEMAEAIKYADQIDSGICRRTAAERFDYHRMSDEYLKSYNIIIENEVRHQDS